MFILTHQQQEAAEVPQLYSGTPLPANWIAVNGPLYGSEFWSEALL